MENVKEFMNFIGCSKLNDSINYLSSNCSKVMDKGSFKFIYITLGEKGGLLAGIGKVGTATVNKFDLIEIQGNNYNRV